MAWRSQGNRARPRTTKTPAVEPSGHARRTGLADGRARRTSPTVAPGVRVLRTRLENEPGGRARDLISKLHAELRNKSRNFSPYCVIRHARCRVGRRIRCHTGCLVGRRIRCHTGCLVGRRIRCHAGCLVGRRKRCRVSCLVEGRVGCRMGRRAGWHVE